MIYLNGVSYELSRDAKGVIGGDGRFFFNISSQFTEDFGLGLCDFVLLYKTESIAFDHLSMHCNGF